MTDMRVEALIRTVRGLPEAMPFVNFVVNPDSFTQTVENIFDLSFAFKNMTAGLQVSEKTKSPVVGKLSSIVFFLLPVHF